MLRIDGCCANDSCSTRHCDSLRINVNAPGERCVRARPPSLRRAAITIVPDKAGRFSVVRYMGMRPEASASSTVFSLRWASISIYQRVTGLSSPETRCAGSGTSPRARFKQLRMGAESASLTLTAQSLGLRETWSWGWAYRIRSASVSGMRDGPGRTCSIYDTTVADHVRKVVPQTRQPTRKDRGSLCCESIRCLGSGQNIRARAGGSRPMCEKGAVGRSGDIRPR